MAEGRASSEVSFTTFRNGFILLHVCLLQQKAESVTSSGICFYQMKQVMEALFHSSELCAVSLLLWACTGQYCRTVRYKETLVSSVV